MPDYPTAPKAEKESKEARLEAIQQKINELVKERERIQNE